MAGVHIVNISPGKIGISVLLKHYFSAVEANKISKK